MPVWEPDAPRGPTGRHTYQLYFPHIGWKLPLQQAWLLVYSLEHEEVLRLPGASLTALLEHHLLGAATAVALLRRVPPRASVRRPLAAAPSRSPGADPVSRKALRALRHRRRPLAQ